MAIAITSIIVTWDLITFSGTIILWLQTLLKFTTFCLFADDHDVVSFITHSLTPPKDSQVGLLSVTLATATKYTIKFDSKFTWQLMFVFYHSDLRCLHVYQQNLYQLLTVAICFCSDVILLATLTLEKTNSYKKDLTLFHKTAPKSSYSQLMHVTL